MIATVIATTDRRGEQQLHGAALDLLRHRQSRVDEPRLIAADHAIGVGGLARRMLYREIVGVAERRYDAARERPVVLHDRA